MRRILCMGILIFLFMAYFPQPGYAKMLGIDPNLHVYINLWKNMLYLMEGDKVLKTFPIAPGKPDTPTPIGDFEVISKAVGWGSGFGSHWLELNVPFGKYGVHGTNKPHLIGSRVSGGCIRMNNKSIKELFQHVPIHTPVRIDGPVLGREGLNYRILVRGSRGSLVQMIQNHLLAGGFYKGAVNGIFNYQMETAVKKFQRESDLPVTGQIHFEDLVELGLVE